jgi:hypothetical protein
MLFAAVLGILGCGDKPDDPGMFLSGTFSIHDAGQSINSPVLVALTRSLDTDLLENSPKDVVIEYMVADKTNGSFRMDLSDKNINDEDEVFLIAFADNNYTGAVPFPDVGDVIGIYAEEGKISPAIRLKSGENDGFHIDINREVFDYDASISGTILGDDAGEVTLVAYAGNIDSSDFTSLNFNAVIGFKTVNKKDSPFDYTLDILPYGKNVPIENVLVFALLDANGSETVDSGDRIGFYGQKDDFSTLLTINDGTALKDIDIEFKFDVKPPCGKDITMSGDFSLPMEYTQNSPPVYIAVFDGSDPAGVLDDPFGSILYFSKIPGGVMDFSFDLSETGLCPDDEIMIVGLWDRDFVGGFPDFTPGDFIGIYAKEGRISPSVRLKAGENSGFHIDINREVFDYTATISGTIRGDDAGSVTLVAYAGDIDSSDFTSLDFNEVVGFKTVNKKDSPLNYMLDILPYGKNVPIKNVQVFALLDANNSQTVDSGDRIGFYGKDDEFSTRLTIEDGTALTEIFIEFKFDVKPPCGTDITLSGDFTLPMEYTQDSPPVYIAVFDGSDPAGVLDDPFSSVLYFSKVGAGITNFSFDLSETGLCPNDEIMIVGLWDRDFAGGFPNFTPGDFIGIYAEEGRISPSVRLKAGENSGFHIDINREVFDYKASISGTILGNDAGAVTLVAYVGDIESSDFTSLDFNEVIGFKTITKSSAPTGYTIDILPYGKNVPIENVQMFALLDANNSQTVDGGDRIGFYSKDDEFSTRLSINDKTALTGIDIEFKFDVKPPCGTEIFLAGDFSLPMQYNQDSPPVYIAVLDGSDPAGVLDDPFAAIRYFSKVPGGVTNFSFDLSETGLCPDDEIMIVGLWDRDFAGGFPNFTPGDYIGIYAEEGRISPSVRLDAGNNSGFHIDISREVFDYEATISGTILGKDSGNVILVAYAGEIVSSDFSTLNFDDVIGYTTVMKQGAPVSYTLDILPYGKNVPIKDVQVFALLDANNSGTVDGGDRIGFYGKGSEYSSLLTITDGAALIHIDIEFKFDVGKASGYEISIAGTFSVPSGYLSGTTPIYITVFDSANPADIIDDPFSTLKYFYKMPATDFYFDCDLSHTDLVPGDEVIVAALWDRDYEGGFPDITKGDKIGLVVNKETYQFTAKLNYGKNVIPPEGFEFKVNKRIYDYTASIDYALDLSDAGSFDMEKAQLIVLSIHVEGIEIGISIAGNIELDIDMDYLLGVDILPATEYDYIGIGEKDDPYRPRQLPVLTALYDQVVVFENNSPPEPLIKGVDHGEELERTAYLVAILDKNGNGQLDGDDEIGYYGTSAIEIIKGIPIIDLPCFSEITIPAWFSGIIQIPIPIKRIVKGRNQEDRDDGSTGPYWISNFIDSSLIQ